MSRNVRCWSFFKNFVFVLYNFHREHSPALSAHPRKGFTKMNLQISKLEALKGKEMTIYLKINENERKPKQNQWKTNAKSMDMIDITQSVRYGAISMHLRASSFEICKFIFVNPFWGWPDNAWECSLWKLYKTNNKFFEKDKLSEFCDTFQWISTYPAIYEELLLIILVIPEKCRYFQPGTCLFAMGERGRPCAWFSTYFLSYLT